jgi:hypothetical protein
VLNVQELAEKVWRSVNKEITVGKVTVKARAFRRYGNLATVLQSLPLLFLMSEN